MLNTVACFKWVVDDADIRVDPTSRKLILDKAGYKISTYDRNAIEECVRLQEQHGGSVAALTVAPSSAKACLKDALSRGPDAAWFVNGPAVSDLTPIQTATLLAAAIRTGIAYDLIVCGEGSGDLYAQQVGPALAEILGLPCVTSVNKLSYSDGVITADRKLDDGIETVVTPVPAVVAILPDINTPRIPSLKQVLGAAKKPVHQVLIKTLGGICSPCLETSGIIAPSMDRRRQKFAADSEGIHAMVNALIREGLLE